MSEPSRPSSGFPRAPLFVAFGMVALALAAAIIGSLTHAGAPLENGTVVTQRDLLFEDREDGAVVVREASDHHEIQVFEGQNGFIRGTLRGFARTRKADNVSPDIPFRLATWSDGRLTLDDPATGRHVELIAFGPDNAAVFARLLPPPDPSFLRDHVPLRDHAPDHVATHTDHATDHAL